MSNPRTLSKEQMVRFAELALAVAKPSQTSKPGRYPGKVEDLTEWERTQKGEERFTLEERLTRRQAEWRSTDSKYQARFARYAQELLAALAKVEEV